MTLLDRHKQYKETIIQNLRTLATIADGVGMKTLAGDIRIRRIPKIEGERFFLVVLGEFNHGKSTFVNALLGDEILPTGITPTTAAINHVVFADSPRATAHLLDGTKQDIPTGNLANWVTVAGERDGDVSHVEVGHPTELLRENITLIDTPGVNDLNEQRADITYGYVPRADAVIFLLDATQALSDSEREFLASHVLEGTRDRLIFVLGKVDLLSDEDRETVLEYTRKNLAKMSPDPAVFPVSARNWLEGKREDSGMEELLQYMHRFLDTDRAQVLLDNAAAGAGRTAAYLERNLGVKQRSFELDVEELETRVDAVRKQLDASKRTLDELHGRIKAESAAIKAQVKLDLDNFARVFAEAMPAQIDAVDANDVKTYLGGFVEDKFKEWAELEGAKIASLLESLAEDVIAVTNENVAAASKTLASRLSPADTEVDIEVDSFKYDLGVYAVGALGTAFLFVNTVAGGLLTLAAPILSIAFRSKVAGDIREQAKERVSPVIHQAAQAMAPHFEKTVDDFAEGLSEFVVSAGNTLYRGISEILDRTIAERKAQGEEVEALQKETSEQIDSVKKVRGSLDELRAAVWKGPQRVV